jgi:hypothetical protein
MPSGIAEREVTMAAKARLIVNGEGEFEVERVIAFLSDIQSAYNSIFAFEIIMAGLWQADPYFPYPGSAQLPLFLGSSAVFVSRRRGSGLRLAGDWPPAPERINSLVPLGDRLVLDAVRIASPGAWEFLGSLNPLEVARRYLNDRHERRKDREWRENAEERRMRLENARLELNLIADTARLAREFGATDRDLAPLVDTLINRPLLALDRHQNQGLISSAQIGPVEKDAE